MADTNVHSTSRFYINNLTSKMLDSIEVALNYWQKNNERHGSTDLARVLEEKYNVPSGFAQGIVKLYFDNHPTLETIRGPGGGIVARGSVKRGNKEKAKRPEKPTPTVPGVNASATPVVNSDDVDLGDGQEYSRDEDDTDDATSDEVSSESVNS